MSHQERICNVIDKGLVARGSLPRDGHCDCTECGKAGLQRSEINRINDYERVCDTCRPLYAPHRVSCNHCNDTGKVMDMVTTDEQFGLRPCMDCFVYEGNPALPDVDAYLDLVTT